MISIADITEAEWADDGDGGDDVTQLPFPVAALPRAVGEFVTAAAGSLQADTSMIAPLTLAALAGSIGNTARIALSPDWREPAIIWACVIAPSSAAKSPAMDHAIAPLWIIESKARAEHKAALAGLADDAPRPKCKRFIVQDVTIEAIAPILEENPRGLLLAVDELSGWFDGIGQYKSGKSADLAKWLQLHGGRELSIDRKANRESIYVASACVSLCGTVQPGALKRVLTPGLVEAGMAGRFLFAMPPAGGERKWPIPTIDPGCRAKYAAVIEALADRQLQTDSAGGLAPQVLPLSSDANTVWGEWFDYINNFKITHPDSIAAAAGKLEGGAARLALIHHLANWAAGGSDHPKRHDEVGADSMRAGVVLARWFLDESLRVHRWLEAGDDGGGVAFVAERLRLMGGTATVRAYRRRWHRRGSTESAELELRRLVDAGLAARIDRPKGPKGGLPTSDFRLI